MAQERFEWLELPDAVDLPKPQPSKTPETVIGKRCPQCDWLDEETALHCFRCGYRYNIDHGMAARIKELGVTLPPRVIDAGQNLDTFFRIYGRTRLPETLSVGGLADELADVIAKDPGNIVSIASRVIDARP